VEPLTGTVPLMVAFTNLSTPTEAITSTLWAYGDSITGTTSALTHTHTYTGAGVYTVTLSVSDGVVTDTLTRTNYITATGGTVYTTTTRVITYTYDKLYRLTDADYSTGESFAYGYDPVGNRTVHTRTLTATTVITYAYDPANRLVNVDGVDYTWDANGNLLSDGVRTFTYDAANRLTSVTSGTLTTTFEYDGLGNRMAQTVDGVTTEYALDVAGGLPEVIVVTTGGGQHAVRAGAGSDPWTARVWRVGIYPAGSFGQCAPTGWFRRPGGPGAGLRSLWGPHVPIYQSTNFPIYRSTNFPVSPPFGYTPLRAQAGEGWSADVALLYDYVPLGRARASSANGDPLMSSCNTGICV
jgi:YD repeat-containing protein